jgi:stalled ribosome rescue protein Dom34
LSDFSSIKFSQIQAIATMPALNSFDQIPLNPPKNSLFWSFAKMMADTRALQVGKSGTVTIRICSQQDYITLASLISKGDAVEATIRVKESRPVGGKHNARFTTGIVRVDEIVTSDSAIGLAGRCKCADGWVGTTKAWLIDGTEFKLTKHCWTREHFDLIATGAAAPTAQAPVISAGRAARAVAEFRELIVTNAALLAFGDAGVLYALDVGAVKTLLASEVAFTRQTKERQKALRNPTFRGAEIIVLAKQSPYYAELVGYGGMVAILKYEIDLVSCL